MRVITIFHNEEKIIHIRKNRERALNIQMFLIQIIFQEEKHSEWDLNVTHSEKHLIHEDAVWIFQSSAQSSTVSAS